MDHSHENKQGTAPQSHEAHHRQHQGHQGHHHQLPHPYQHHMQQQQEAYGYQHQYEQQWGAQGQMVYYPGYGYQYPLQHMEGVPLPPGIPGLGGSTDPLEAVLGPFPCVKLGSLPYDASLEDILLLFQGLVVIDVIILGQGEAFVIFANPMDFQMALQRHRQTIGRRFIEIAPASRADYYEAIADQHLREQEGRPQLSSATSGEDMGTGGDDQSGEASPVAALWGHSTGSPPMQSLSGSQGYGELMGQHGIPDGAAMGGRAGVGPGGLHAPLQKRTGGGIQVGDHTGFLRMRGLPFSAAKEDIFRFFASYSPIEESIVLTYRNDGRATGEAYIAFASAEDSKRAMDLHRKSMGSRYIELFISNKDEQGRALARFGNR